MGKIMYKGQEYGGSGGGGEMPSCYDDLTELLENDVLTADTTNNVLRGSFEGELKLGYIQDAYTIDENGDPVDWGDTEQTGLTGAIGDICDRIATLEQGGGGGLPSAYDDLTAMLQNGDLSFDAENNVIELTGYNMILNVSNDHIVDTNNWGSTQQSDLGDALSEICGDIDSLDSRVEALEEGGGGGEMPAVYDDLTELLNDGVITFNTSNNMVHFDDHSEIELDGHSTLELTGYSTIYVDNNSDIQFLNTLGDTGETGLIAAITNLSNRIRALEGN